MKTLLTFCLTFLIGLAAMAQAPVIMDYDGTPRTGFEIPTLKPQIDCPGMDTFFVFWWQMALPGGGGDGPYFHNMAPVTDGEPYHLGVDDSHLLTPGTGWCFICLQGDDYNAVGAAWGIADSAGGITPSPDCSMVPSWNYSVVWPNPFTYDEPAAEMLGEGWTVWLSNSPSFTGPGIYKTPRSSNLKLYNTSTSTPPWVPYEYLRVRFTFTNGTQCTVDSVLGGGGLRTAPPVITDFSGRVLEEPLPAGFYLKNGKVIKRD